MGGLLSYLFAASEEVPDPVTGLTEKEKKAVRATWELVKADYKNTGIALFLKFFKVHPEYQKHFKGFANEPYEQLGSNPKVHAHAANVLYAITSFVDSLDDVQCLEQMLLKLAKNHHGRKIQIQQFEHLASVILSFLPERFGPKVGPVAVEGWVKVFKAINSILAIGLERARQGTLD